MMPFCSLVDGFEATLASPFMPDFLCSGSGVGARWTSLACCSSSEDIGTALAQRIALYLQRENDTWIMKSNGGLLLHPVAPLTLIILTGFVWELFSLKIWWVPELKDLFLTYVKTLSSQLWSTQNEHTCCSSLDCLSQHHSRRCRGDRCLSVKLSGHCRHGHWLSSSSWIWNLQKKTPEVRCFCLFCNRYFVK